jgi:hypothetical protein
MLFGSTSLCWRFGSSEHIECYWSWLCGLHCSPEFNKGKESLLGKRMVQNKTTICTRKLYETLKTKWVKKKMFWGWMIGHLRSYSRFVPLQSLNAGNSHFSQCFSLRYATWPLHVQWNSCWPPVFTVGPHNLYMWPTDGSHVALWKLNCGSISCANVQFRVQCCILRGPGGKHIVDVVPRGTELEPQVKTGSWAGRTHNNPHVKSAGVYCA